VREIKYGLADTAGFTTIMKYMQEYISGEYVLKEDENPDYLFCACFGKSIMPENTIRIQYIGENISPDFNVYDYAIGFDFIEFGDRYLRYPLYALAYRENFEKALKKHLIKENELKKKDKFCSFVVSNGREDDIRTKFFLKLSEYKRVESGGRYKNNIGYSLKGRNSKADFQSQCKFAIAFENSSTPGYTTEKLIEAWEAGTIPIYWGNPRIADEFNTKAFINCHDYENLEQVIEKIIEIDNDDELYMAMMKEPILYDGCIAEQYVDRHCLTKFLDNILNQDKEKAYRRSSYYSHFGKNYIVQASGLNLKKNMWMRVKDKLRRK